MLLFLACIIPNSCSLSIISEQFYSITTPYTDNAIMISVCSFFNIKADALVIVSGSHTNILEMRMCSIAQAFSKSLIKFEGKDFDLSYCCQEDSSFSENLVKATCRSGGHYRYFFEDCIVECECKDTIVKLEMEDSTLQNNHVNITNIKSNGLNNYFDYLSLIDFESQYIVIQNGNYNELVSSTLSQAALQFYDILNCSFKTMESVLVGKIENSAFFYNKIDKLYNDQNLFFFDCIFDFDFPISSNFVNCLKSSTLITKNINSITKHPNLLDPYPTPTPPFSPSSVFSASKPFTESEMRTQTFKPTNSFQPTDIFKPTNPFTPSHSFTSSFPFRTPVTQFGLLSDADVKSSNGKWGELTTTQKVVTLTANAGVISGIVVAFLCYLKAKWKQLMRKVNSDDFENMVDESEASDSSYSYYVYSYSTSSSDKDDEFYEKEELMILCDNELKFLYETPYL